MRKMLFALSLLVLTAAVARADTITVPLSYSGADGAVVFNLPAGHSITSVTLAGTFTALYPNDNDAGVFFRPAGLTVEGFQIFAVLVPENSLASFTLSFAFPESAFGLFADGQASYHVSSSDFITYGGIATFTIMTAPAAVAPVPEPATLLLLATGFAGAATRAKWRPFRSRGSRLL